MKDKYTPPTAEELVQLLMLSTDAHDKPGEKCPHCENEAINIQNPLIQACLGIIVAGGPNSAVTMLSHFFYAGALWQEKQASIYKDASELAKLFSLCDSRQEKLNNS